MARPIRLTLGATPEEVTAQRLEKTLGVIQQSPMAAAEQLAELMLGVIPAVIKIEVSPDL